MYQFSVDQIKITLLRISRFLKIKTFKDKGDVAVQKILDKKIDFEVPLCST